VNNSALIPSGLGSEPERSIQYSRLCFNIIFYSWTRKNVIKKIKGVWVAKFIAYNTVHLAKTILLKGMVS
jgi:hypothetical protein